MQIAFGDHLLALSPIGVTTERVDQPGLPVVQNAIADPLTFVVALVFTTLLALVGAIFIGVFLSHRLLSTAGFTPFEEEMLRMRADLREVKRDVGELRGRTDPRPGDDSDSDEEDS